MAINFPDSPTAGAIFTGTNGVLYTYDGTRWRVTSSVSSIIPPANNTNDLGSANLAWRALYVNTLNVLSTAASTSSSTGALLVAGGVGIQGALHVRGQIYTQGFLLGPGTEFDPIYSSGTASTITATNISNWNTAYSWGNHATQGYLTTGSFATLTNHLLPAVDSAIDLGSPAKKWRSLYVSTNTIYIGTTTLSIVDGELSLGGVKQVATTSTLKAGTSTITLSENNKLSVPGQINFGMTGEGAPNTSTYIGEKLVLWDNGGAYAGESHFAIGIENGHMWFATDTYNDPGNGFKWYAQEQELMKLDSSGTLIVTKINVPFATSSSFNITTFQDFGFEQIGFTFRVEGNKIVLPTGNGTIQTGPGGSYWSLDSTNKSFTFPNLSDIEYGDGAALSTGTLQVRIDYGGEFKIRLNNSNKTWTFDNSGSIIFPDGTTQTSALNLGQFKISGNNLGTIDNPNTGSWGGYDMYIDPGNGSNAFIYIPGLANQAASTNLQISNNSTGASIQLFGRGGVQVVTNAGVNEKIFEFADNGQLFIPNDIIGAGGQAVVIQNTASGVAYLELPVDPSINSVILANQAASSATVTIRVGDFGSERNWTFNEFGSLSVPGTIYNDDTSNVGQLLLGGDTGEPDSYLALPSNVGSTSFNVRLANLNGSIQLYAGNNSWLYNNGGDFQLPRGGSITENIVTNELWGSTTTSLTLIPGGAATAEQRLEIYSTGGGEGNHIHITSGDQTQTDLFLGNDTQYFAVAANGQNYIQARNGYASPNPGTSAGPGANVNIYGGNAGDNGGNVADGNSGGDVFIASGISTAGLGGNIYLQTSSGPDGFGSVKLSTDGGGTYLEFDKNDKLTFPSGGDIEFDSSATSYIYGVTGIEFANATTQTTAWTKAAASVQSTPPVSPVTGQLYYDTDDGRTYIYTGSAWIDSSPAAGSGVTSITAGTGTAVSTSTGAITIWNTGGGGNVLEETFETKNAVTGVTVHDCTTNRLFYLTNVNANFTPNFTNLNLASGEATSVSIVVVQTSTARSISGVQIAGTTTGVTLSWQGSVAAPSGNASRTEVFTFSVLCTGTNAYTVLGMMTSFGGV